MHNNGNGNDTTGGGITNFVAGATISNSVFLDNYSNAGTGIYSSADMAVVNCVFAGGRAVAIPEIAPGTIVGEGGAIYSAAAVALSNCAITDNWANKIGGGVVNGGASVDNCVLWGNTVTPPLPGEDPLFPIRIQINGGANIAYSDVEGVFDTIPGGDPPDLVNFSGCFDADLVLTDPATADYRPTSGSPCMDVGDNSAVRRGARCADGRAVRHRVKRGRNRGGRIRNLRTLRPERHHRKQPKQS